MIEIERLVAPGTGMSGAERLGPRPRLERGTALPHRVRGVERVVLMLRPLEQVELDEAWDLLKVRVAARPYMLEVVLRALLHAEAIHGDEHGYSPHDNGSDEAPHRNDTDASAAPKTDLCADLVLIAGAGKMTAGELLGMFGAPGQIRPRPIFWHRGVARRRVANVFG